MRLIDAERIYEATGPDERTLDVDVKIGGKRDMKIIDLDLSDDEYQELSEKAKEKGKTVKELVQEWFDYTGINEILDQP